MKILVILIAICFIFTNVAYSNQQIREEHAKTLKLHGDNLENPTHYHFTYSHVSLSGTTIERPFSIFISERKASYYQEYDGKKIQMLSECNPNELIITNRLTLGEKVLVCKYIIGYKPENIASLDVRIDDAESNLKIDLQKLFACIVTNYPDVAEAIKSCMNQAKWMECLLKLAIPLYKIYQCIFKAQMIGYSTQRVNKKYYSATFGNGNNYPRYYQLENLPVAFKETKITSHGGVTFAAVDSVVNNGVLKVICQALTSGIGSWYVNATVTIIYGQ